MFSLLSPINSPQTGLPPDWPSNWMVSAPLTRVCRLKTDQPSVQLGKHVGVSYGGKNLVSIETRLSAVTCDVLVAYLKRDPTLAGYAVVILDEIHERDVNVDIALWALRNVSTSFSLFLFLSDPLSCSVRVSGPTSVSFACRPHSTCKS